MITRRKFFSFFGAGAVMATAPGLFPTRPYWTYVGKAEPYSDWMTLDQRVILAVARMPDDISQDWFQDHKIKTLLKLGVGEIKWNPLTPIGTPVYVSQNYELKVGDKIHA